jgi:alanine dehydrogenase
VTGADLIVLATASTTPVVESHWVSDGAHVMCVGACRPDQREMPTALVARASLYVDSRAAARREAGDFLIPLGEGAIGDGHIAGELGELAAGRAQGRRSPQDITIFKSLGLAVEDVVTARLVVDRAAAAGLGQTFSLQ